MGGSISLPIPPNPTLCTLTLLPFQNCDWPRPTKTLDLKKFTRFDLLGQFPPWLDNNLCISYQGSQCKGAYVEVFKNKGLSGKILQVVLQHNAGTVCMSKDVKTSASSIYALLPLFPFSAKDASSLSVAADGLSIAADVDENAPFDLGLNQLFEDGFLEAAALERLQKEDPAVLEEALHRLQAQSPEVIAKLGDSLPITLAQVNELLKL